MTLTATHIETDSLVGAAPLDLNLTTVAPGAVVEGQQEESKEENATMQVPEHNTTQGVVGKEEAHQEVRQEEPSKLAADSAPKSTDGVAESEAGLEGHSGEGEGQQLRSLRGGSSTESIQQGA